MNKREKGKVWEDFAAKYLEGQGYHILFRNWTCHWGELDLITLTPEKDVLAFVEVKFRDEWFGDAYEAVSFYKMRALRRTAQFFLQKEKPLQKSFRFDVVTVTKFPGRVETEHFQAVDQEL